MTIYKGRTPVNLCPHGINLAEPCERCFRNEKPPLGNYRSYLAKRARKRVKAIENVEDGWAVGLKPFLLDVADALDGQSVSESRFVLIVQSIDASAACAGVGPADITNRTFPIELPAEAVAIVECAERHSTQWVNLSVAVNPPKGTNE